MRKGSHPGGKVSSPIRELVKTNKHSKVIFICEDEDRAESVRLSALAVRRRNKYDNLKTSLIFSNSFLDKEG